MPSLLAYGGCLGLGCVPLAWQHAHGGLLLPWPWLHALALAACLVLGCVPWTRQHAACHGGLLPWPSLLHALGCVPWPWQRWGAACLGCVLHGACGGCLGLGSMHASMALAACLGLGSVPWGGCMPWPWLLHGLGCVPWPSLLHGLGCVPWPWLHALALAACLGLGCMPWPWQRALGGCMPWPWLRALGGCMPRPWLRAMGGSPWPWQHALALAACQHAMALAACLGLGSMPWPWPSLPCPQILSDFPKNEGFLEKEVIFPQRGRRWAWQGAQGHARMHATPHRPASSRTPAKLARAFSPFCVPKFSP